VVVGIEKYLKENIDDQVSIEPWQKNRDIPVFLRDMYKYYSMNLLDTAYLLVEILDETPGVGTIVKHIRQLEGITNRRCVLYFKDITRYRRKSLIQHRIPFVIGEGQIFLPFLGLDLDRVPEYVQAGITRFSSSTQLVFLFFLNHRDTVINTTKLAELLDQSVMTSSRALNDLHVAKLVSYEVGGKTGRSKEYRRIGDPEFFREGRKYLKSPVRKVLQVREVPEGTLEAGLTALAAMTLLNPPKSLVYAVGGKEFRELDVKVEENTDIVKDETLVELQVWDYDPKRFGNERCVDVLSLYASLKDVKDERIEQALDESLRGKEWFTD
jgi:hypothetical protein